MDMEIKIEELIDENQKAIQWKLNKGNGAIVIDLNKIMDVEIIECT